MTDVAHDILELERQWAAAIQRRDVAATEKFLAKKYFLAIAVHNRPMELVQRDAWLSGLKKYSTEPFQLDEIDVHVHGSTAVAFMLFSHKPVAGVPDPAPFVMVDIWNKEGKGWRVAERHWSRPEPPEAAGD